MKPVFCIVRHDPERGKYGDCLRACVASLLDLQAEDVPHFFHDNCSADIGYLRMREWLETVGYVDFWSVFPRETSLDDILMHMAATNPTAHYLLFHRTINGGEHVVVCRGGSIVHNPAWIREQIGGPMGGENWPVMVIARK